MAARRQLAVVPEAPPPADFDDAHSQQVLDALADALADALGEQLALEELAGFVDDRERSG